MWFRRIEALILVGASFALSTPALAQQLPPLPPQFDAAQAAWAQARENWLVECTWNQSRGNRDRADAREFCEAYLANHSGYGRPYQGPMIAAPMGETPPSGYQLAEGGGGPQIYMGGSGGGGTPYRPQRAPMPRLGAASFDAAHCPALPRQ